MIQEYVKIIATAVANVIPRDSVMFRIILVFRSSNKEQKRMAMLSVLGASLVILFVVAYVFGFGNIWVGLFSPISPITYIMYVLIMILIVILLSRSKYRGSISGVDSFTGRSTVENGSYGSSKWMTYDRADEVFNISPITQTTSIIYGQIPDTKPGTAVISNKAAKDGSVKESNTIVFGSPGKGKSVAKVIPDVFQCMKQGTSFAVTDPKGEIRQETIHLLRTPKEEGGYGFKTYTFNTKDPNMSNGWNALEEVISPDTGRLDAIRLNLWVKIYFDNTAGAGEQKYFRDGAEDLMKVLISIMTWRRETYIATALNTMYQKVSRGKKLGNDELITVNLIDFEEMVLTEAQVTKCDIDLVKERIKEIHSSAPKVNIDMMCALEPKIDKIANEMDNLPADHPGKIAWANLASLKTSNEKAWSSMTSGLHNRLNLFVDRNLRMMLSTDEISLHDITKEPTGLYIITKDGDSTYSPILSLFFTFLIMDSKEEFDKQAERDANWVNKRTPLQVILDEMYSIGVIGGKPVMGQPAWLASQLATVRSRLINMTMIFQSWTQLVELYGDMPSSSIMNCCSNIMFLGGNDLKSLEFLSKYTGDTSVVNESYSETSTFFGKNRSDDTKISTAKVALLTPDELRRMPERQLVLFHSGEHPIRLATFYYKDDPITSLLKPVNIRDDITTISERMERGEIGQSAFYIEVDKPSYITDNLRAIQVGINNDKYHEDGNEVEVDIISEEEKEKEEKTKETNGNYNDESPSRTENKNKSKKREINQLGEKTEVDATDSDDHYMGNRTSNIFQGQMNFSGDPPITYTPSVKKRKR